MSVVGCPDRASLQRHPKHCPRSRSPVPLYLPLHPSLVPLYPTSRTQTPPPPGNYDLWTTEPGRGRGREGGGRPPEGRRVLRQPSCVQNGLISRPTLAGTGRTAGRPRPVDQLGLPGISGASGTDRDGTGRAGTDRGGTVHGQTACELDGAWCDHEVHRVWCTDRQTSAGD